MPTNSIENKTDAYLIDEKSGYLYPLSMINTIGSDSSCNIQANGDKVQGRHGRIEFKNGAFVLKNMRAGELLLNETKAIEAELTDGDQLIIGDHPFTFSLTAIRQKKKTQLTSKNEKWQNSLLQIENMANSPFPIVLIGESGTGKDILTKELHENSERSHEALVSVNCSALSPQLIESELFGHLKGSFTGAESDRKGAFVAAHKGTLFLDEIGDLPLDLQPKLLRALENNEIKPVGADTCKKVDVRIIAATHKPLHKLVQEKKFRQDLYYRLNVLNLNPPSLRNRMEDFDDIFYFFAKKFRVRFSFEAIKELKSYEWPGNIRELKNFVIKASVIYKGKTVTKEYVQSLMSQIPLVTQNLIHPGNVVDLKKQSVLKQNEIDLICKALVENHGNQRKAALLLGMPTSTLNDRIRTYKIDLEKIKRNQAA